MNLQKIIREHKNTVTGVISVLMFLFLSWELVSGKIDFITYSSYLAVVGGAVGTIVSFLAPDGKSDAKKAEEEAALIEKIREQLKQETQQKQNEENKIPVCNCGNASAGCECLRTEAGQL